MLFSIPEGQNDKLIIDCLSSTWPGLVYLYSAGIASLTTCLHANLYFYCKNSKLLNNIEWTRVLKAKKRMPGRIRTFAMLFTLRVTSPLTCRLHQKLKTHGEPYQPMRCQFCCLRRTVKEKLLSRSWEIWNLSLAWQETQLFPQQVSLPLLSVTCPCVTSLASLLCITSSLTASTSPTPRLASQTGDKDKPCP